MMERTRMLSVAPGTCAGSMQAPRTIRSICTPAWPARTSASMRATSVSAFILATMRPGTPWRAPSATWAIFSTSRRCRWNGAIHRCFRRGSRLWLARWENTASISLVRRVSAVRWLMSV